jgi:hypothetical protein
MYEVLDEANKPQLTADGRFFMPVDVDPVTPEAQRPPADPVRLTPEQAQAELHNIFSGEGAEEAQMLYAQGLREIIVPGHSEGGTPALDLYIRVQSLSYDAAAAFDHPKN